MKEMTQIAQMNHLAITITITIYIIITLTLAAIISSTSRDQPPHPQDSR